MTQNVSIAGMRLELVGRAGPSGVFQASGAIKRVNMLDLLRDAGVASLLRDLIVWRLTKTSVLIVRLPAAHVMSLRALEWKQAPVGKPRFWPVFVWPCLARVLSFNSFGSCFCSANEVCMLHVTPYVLCTCHRYDT
jgi:hypothetical protein